jgi:transposase-like protein
VGKAFEEVSASFDRFCLAAGIAALGEMMEKDAADACGPRHSRGEGRRGYRWGRTRGKIAFHAGKMEIERPRVRDIAGRELALPSWEHATGEDWLGKWAMNLMLLNVSTRKFRRAVRLPEGDVPAPAGSGVSKSAASRHFVALSSARLREWLAAELSGLDLLVVQIDGIHISENLVLVAAIGIDGEGIKHPLALMEGATENAAVAQALIDNLIERGLDPAVPRLFIIDGSKALPRSDSQKPAGAFCVLAGPLAFRLTGDSPTGSVMPSGHAHSPRPLLGDGPKLSGDCTGHCRLATNVPSYASASVVE